MTLTPDYTCWFDSDTRHLCAVLTTVTGSIAAHVYLCELNRCYVFDSGTRYLCGLNCGHSFDSDSISQHLLLRQEVAWLVQGSTVETNLAFILM